MRAVVVLVATVLFAATPAFGAGATYTVGPITDVSASCAGQNAEVEEATDPSLGYVYETWMGCRGIAFVRSTDGGATFGTPIPVRGSPSTSRRRSRGSGRSPPRPLRSGR